MDQKIRKVFKKWVKSQTYYQRDWLAERAELAAKIKELAVDGKVVIVSGGMDCDGVRYSGATGTVDAIPRLVIKAMDDIYKWADGPVSCRIVSPIEGKQIKYESRDLGMEAFENGHPHVIHG